MDQDAKPIEGIFDSRQAAPHRLTGERRSSPGRGDALEFLKSLGLLGLAAVLTAAFFNATHGASRAGEFALPGCQGKAAIAFALPWAEGPRVHAGHDAARATCRA